MTPLVLSPKAHAIGRAAIAAALDGGTLELADDTQRLVCLTLGAPAFDDDGEAHDVSGYGLAKGTPTRMACLDKSGAVLLSGPSTVKLDPPEVIPGALVTVSGLTLRERA